MDADLSEATTVEEDQIGEEIQEEVIGKTIQAIIRTQEIMVTMATEAHLILTGNCFTDDAENTDTHKVIAGVFHRIGQSAPFDHNQKNYISHTKPTHVTCIL